MGEADTADESAAADDDIFDVAVLKRPTTVINVVIATKTDVAASLEIATVAPETLAAAATLVHLNLFTHLGLI